MPRPAIVPACALAVALLAVAAVPARAGDPLDATVRVRFAGDRAGADVVGATLAGLAARADGPGLRILGLDGAGTLAVSRDYAGRLGPLLDLIGCLNGLAVTRPGTGVARFALGPGAGCAAAGS